MAVVMINQAACSRPAEQVGQEGSGLNGKEWKEVVLW